MRGLGVWQVFGVQGCGVEGFWVSALGFRGLLNGPGTQ